MGTVVEDGGMAGGTVEERGVVVDVGERPSSVRCFF
jgi:hypothetical protein